MNQFRTKKRKNAIEPDFYEPTQWTAVRASKDQRQDSDKFKNAKLISDKLHSEEFNISRVSKIGAIGAGVISKAFTELTSFGDASKIKHAMLWQQ